MIVFIVVERITGRISKLYSPFCNSGIIFALKIDVFPSPDLEYTKEILLDKINARISCTSLSLP